MFCLACRISSAFSVWRAASLLLSLSWALTGISHAETEHQKHLREAHERALSADKHGIDEEIAKFEAALGKDGQDALARAYLGSACALRAKESFWGATKQKYLERAEKELDQAVNDAPDDARVRMIRAIAAYKIPKKFGKRAQSLEDFGKIIPVAKEGKGDLTTRERQAILYYASQCYAEEGHAGHEELLAKSHEIDPHSDIGQLAAP